MLKAVITNDLPEKSTPPPEIESNASIFASPSQTKLNFLEQLLKWLLTQNMDENLKFQLYQDALSKATAINNNIQSEKITNIQAEDPPEEPDNSFYKNQYFILKKSLEDSRKSPPPTSIYTLQKDRKRKATSFVSNKYKHFPKKIKTRNSQTKEPIY